MTVAESSQLLTLAPICTGPVGDPPLTLGWDILRFGLDYFEQPGQPGNPFEPTDEQLHFLLWWYAVNPDGSWVYTGGHLRRMKGWGKDPLAAYIAAVELVGPCRVGGWTKDGQPIGVQDPSAWIQVAGVSQDQTKNTMTVFPGLFGKRKAWEKQGRAIREFGLDVGKEIIYAEANTKRIEAITSSPSTVEGQRSTFVIKNETQEWRERNGGLAMAGVIAGNVAKIPAGMGRALAIANAYRPGRGSDAEADHRKYLDQLATGRVTFLYDSRESPKVEFKPVGTGPLIHPEDPQDREREITEADIERRDDLVRAGLRAARGDSYWLNLKRLMDEFYDTTIQPSEWRRKYLNQINAAEDSFLNQFEWMACRNEGLKLVPGELVTLGLDGSRTTAHTVLVACRVSDSALFPLGIWDPSKFAGHEIPRGQVRGAVEKARTTYDVVGFYSDVHPFETDVDEWHQVFREQLCVHATDRNYVGWDHRGRLQTLTKAVESFKAAVIAQELSHPGDPELDQYVYNAVLVENSFGWMYDKESPNSSNEVDGLDACVMARLARQDYLNLPENKKRKKASVVLWTPRMRNKNKGGNDGAPDVPTALRNQERVDGAGDVD